MNDIKIWCPYCRKYQSIKPRNGGLWLVDGCGNWFCDNKGQYIKGFDKMMTTLKKGVWSVGGKYRNPKEKPPVKKEKPPDPYMERLMQVCGAEKIEIISSSRNLYLSQG